MGNSCDKVKHFKDQNFSKLQSECRKRGELFVDPEFAPAGNLLPRGSESQGSGYRSEIVWLRPGQICQNNNNEKPKFSVGSQDRFDINQGELGDCWLLASLSTLAETPHYMNQVVPPGQTFEKNYQGIFRFRFFWLGDWYQVVVDDRLPTRNGKLIYLRSNAPNEFWAALLEKAYAKFYGSYAAIQGGHSIDAAVDFTGGIPQIVKVSPDMKEEEKQKLFDWLKLCSANGALISASLGETHSQEAKGKGLKENHFYTVSKVVDTRTWFSSQNKQLIRLRNPHGAGDEWTGDWCDGSGPLEVSQGGKEEMKKSKDGEFRMGFMDFVKYFGRIDIVHLSPIRMPLNKRRMTRQFKEFAVSGKWISDVRAGGTSNLAQNSQYRFTLANCRDKFPDCSMVISLSQDSPRGKEHSIGFKVYKLSPEKNQEPLLGREFFDDARNLAKEKEPGVFVNVREVTQVLNLPAGHYCIVPSTFHANQEADFLLRLWVDNRWYCDLERRPGRRVADHQCCFVCCHFGGKSCGCCGYLCMGCQACCGCSTQDEGDFYQKQ